VNAEAALREILRRGQDIIACQRLVGGPRAVAHDLASVAGRAGHRDPKRERRTADISAGGTAPAMAQGTTRVSPLDRSVHVTFFRSHAAINKGEARYTPRELAERIRSTTADTKAALPWLKLARFGNRKTDQGSLRHDANVLAVSGIEADYDGGQVTFDEARETLEKQGLAAILYTSPSHTEDAPRWRVLCPLAEEAKPTQRRHLFGRLNGLFRGVFANESWTLSQSYYFGSVGNKPSHQVALIDGPPIDQHDDLDELWIGPPGTAGGTTAGTEAGKDARQTAEMVRLILTGEHYHCELRALAARLIGQNVPAGIAAELLRGIMLASLGPRDERWTDRYYGIEDLITSAVRKYRADAAIRRDNDRKLCGLAMDLCRQRRPSDEVCELVRARADALGLSEARAHSITEWAFRTARERRRGHA
jgi:hypothetical protein